jgi:hypothetical protein
MRWAKLLFCFLFLAFTFAGATTPLLASDLKEPRQAYPDDGPDSDDDPAIEATEFCYTQRKLCRKVCHLRSRFEDNFDGCSSSCGSREIRCTRTGCFRWAESEFLIAERFGGYKCAQ